MAIRRSSNGAWAGVRSRREFLRLGGRGVGLAACAFAWPLLEACGGTGGGQRNLLGALPAFHDPAAPRQARAGVLRFGATPGTLGGVLLPLVSAQLCAVDPRSGEVYGDLATRVEAAGELRLAFTLRPDLRFHPSADGLAAALTADDVQRDFAARAAAHEFLFSEVVASVEAPDLQTVVLQLRAPYATLFEGLADPAQAAIRGVGHYQAINLPLGAGPFIPAEADGDAVLLGANQLYHRPTLPLLEAIEVEIRADQPTLDGLALSRGLDVHRLPTATELPPDLGLRRASRPSRGMFGVAMSVATLQRGDRPGASGPFADERTRRAVALSLDREALLAERRALESGPVGPAFAADALKPEELRGHSIYRRQPQAAVGLLAAAGHPELAFSMLAPDTVDARALLTSIQKQVAEAGMRMRPTLVPAAEWEGALRGGEFESILFDSPNLRTPDAGLRLHTSAGVEGTFSPWGYSNPVYDAAVRTALTALAPSERATRSRAAQRVLLDSVPALLPIGTRIEEAWVNTSLQGFEWDADSFNDGWFAATWRMLEQKRRTGRPDPVRYPDFAGRSVPLRPARQL